MAIEVIGALGIAALVLWLVFGVPAQGPDPGLEAPEPEAPEETRRGLALLALKEIEFDRETGKLSEPDYALLKERYSAEALRALAAESREAPDRVPVCPVCGPRPEPDAVFCSYCGRILGTT